MRVRIAAIDPRMSGLQAVRAEALLEFRGRLVAERFAEGQVHGGGEPLLNADVASFPFRELWMKDGMQTFEELQTL